MSGILPANVDPKRPEGVRYKDYTKEDWRREANELADKLRECKAENKKLLEPGYANILADRHWKKYETEGSKKLRQENRKLAKFVDRLQKQLRAKVSVEQQEIDRLSEECGKLQGQLAYCRGEVRFPELLADDTASPLLWLMDAC